MIGICMQSIEASFPHKALMLGSHTKTPGQESNLKHIQAKNPRKALMLGSHAKTPG